MCNIIQLHPGQMIPDDKLQNMCYNNWHSFGLVVRIPATKNDIARLDITKEVPESGEIDWKKIKDLLDKNIDLERWLHVRHTTAGTTTIDNCHPFDVYYDERTGKQIVFMHNGTLHNFKSKKPNPNSNGSFIDDDDGPSDTQNYVNQILQPAVAGMDFGDGIGDIQNGLFKRFIRSDWIDDNNRGVLIANDQQALILGKWKLRYFGEKTEENRFLTSNDEYFDEVKRGPEHSRRLVRERQEREAREAQQKAAKSTSKGRSSVPIVSVKDLIDQLNNTYKLSSSAANLLSDFDFYLRDKTVAVGNLTMDEIEELYLHETDCINVMNWVFTDYASLYDEFCESETKHEKATKMIATLKTEIERLEAENEKLKNKGEKNVG